MTAAVRNDLTRHLAREPLLQLYAIIGTDPMLRDEAVTHLKQCAVSDGAVDFNCDHFQAGDTPIDHIISAARTLPCFAARRFVHISRIHKCDAKTLTALATYAANPVATTVLCISGEKLDQRTTCAKAFQHAHGVFVVDPPRPHALAGWWVQRAQAQGIRLDMQAAQLMVDLIGTDLGSLDMATQKAALYGGHDPAAVTLADVEATVAPTRVHSIFELTDAMGQRNLPHASLLLRQALDNGDSALLVLTMIARQFRHLIQLKALQQRGASEQVIVQEMGIRPFLLRPLREQAERYQTHELYRALHAASLADRTLKSSRMDHNIVLEALLLDMSP